jgi:hypothetical protein
VAIPPLPFSPVKFSGLIEREGSIVRLAPAHLSISNEVFVAIMR